MNRVFKKVIFCFFFGIHFLSIGFKSAYAQEQKADFKQMINVIYSTLKVFNDSNYYTSDKIVFDICGQEVVFDLGFAGHGNLFVPFLPIPAKIDDNAGNLNNPENVTFLNIAKIAIKNELHKKLNKIDGLNLLLDFKLSPLQVFIFKFLLLFKTTSQDLDITRFIEEVFCLLFRLRLVEDLDLIDKSRPLSYYLPNEAKKLLKADELGLLEFIDEIWFVFLSDKNSYDQNSMSDMALQIKSFVFRDKDLAKQVYEKFKTCSEELLYQQIDSFIRQKGFEIVDFSKFVEFRNDFGDNMFAESLVGYEESFVTNYSNVPLDLINQIKNLQTKPGIVFAQDTDQDEYWVTYVSQDLNGINVLKKLLLVTTQFFRDYLKIKESIFKSNDDVSLKYRMEFAAKEKSRVELEKFIRTTEGGDFFAQLKKEVTRIVESDALEWENANKEVLELERGIAELKKLRVDKSKELDKWKSLMSNGYVENKKDIEIKVAQVQKELQSLESNLLLKQDNLKLLKEDLSEADKSTDLVKQDKKKLVQLHKILDEKKQNGAKPSEKLLKAVEKLEQKVADNSRALTSVKSIDKKLAVREDIANLFDRKADELKNLIALQLDDLKKVSDLEDRVIQELLVDDIVDLQSNFAQRLESVAKLIRQDNVNARKLEAYRKASTVIDSNQISQDKLRELNRLELEVGHIIDNEKHEDFISKLMFRESLVTEFLKDVTYYPEKFTFLLQRLQNSLEQVVANSTGLRDHPEVCKLIWYVLPFNWKTFLRYIGVLDIILN